MSNSKLLAELIPNMVAGKDSLSGSGKSGPSKFSETNFDGWVVFMKALLGRYDRADEALEMDYPKELLDDDGEPMSLSTKKNAEALEQLQEKWKVKNQICFGLLMNVCWRNSTARKIAKRCKENNEGSPDEISSDPRQCEAS